MLQLVDVSLAYSKNTELVLTGVNLRVSPNDVIALVGPSGIGKSTFLRSLVNPKLIVSGSYTFKGKEVLKLKKREWRKQIRRFGYMNQFIHLVGYETVFTNIKRFYPKERRNFWNYFLLLSKQQKLKLATTLQELGLLHKIFTPVFQLSGGERQRVEACRLLLQNSEFILADEPTAALDLQNAKLIMNLLINYAKRQGVPLIFSTHTLELTRNFANKIIRIENKKLVLESVETCS